MAVTNLETAEHWCLLTVLPMHAPDECVLCLHLDNLTRWSHQQISGRKLTMHLVQVHRIIHESYRGVFI
jgi:hypothetical protein